MLKYSNAQMLKYSNTQILKCSNAQMLKYSNAQILDRAARMLRPPSSTESSLHCFWLKICVNWIWGFLLLAATYSQYLENPLLNQCWWTAKKNIARGTKDPGYRVWNFSYLWNLNEYKFNSVENIIQVIDSIPWVRCTSGNVLIIVNIYWGTFFGTFSARVYFSS